MIFRYPGAKTKLAPKLIQYMCAVDTFGDAFVGGGSVLLYMAEEYPIGLVAGESNPRISAFWKLCATGKVQQLADRIHDTKPTLDSFNVERARTPTTVEDLAFQGVFFNRCCFNGILSSGPIGGKKQGKYTVGCRFNGPRLASDIVYAGKLLRDRLQVVNDYKEVKADLTYYDPPYYKQGKALYGCDFKHEELFAHLRKRSDWILSYDDCPWVRETYLGYTVEELDWRNHGTHKKAKELFYTCFP